MSRPSGDNRAKGRPARRIPINGEHNILTVEGLDPNYEYRWVNDEPGRIDRFKLAGYETVEHDVTVGDATADTSSQVGKVVTRPVGSGFTGYLMRIPKEYYEEDKAAFHRDIDEQEAAILADINSGTDGKYGKLEIKR